MNTEEYNKTKENIELWQEDGWWIISHKDMNVTTQGETRLEALLMLADAIAAYTDSDENLVEMSEDVFIPDEEMLALMDKLEQDEEMLALMDKLEDEK